MNPPEKKRPKRIPKRRHIAWLAVVSVLLLAVSVGCAVVVFRGQRQVDGVEVAGEEVGRTARQASALGDDDATVTSPVDDDDENSAYPKVFFSEEDMKNGAVALCLAGVFYMFAALAFVCDDFFVPALEVITDRLGLSEDVAGATFMAAGGSAPELFTSFIGVFVAKSNVGFGTIVGSAVFNILFVIGFCAVLTRDLDPKGLPLTWWPLFRDSMWYSLALVVLSIFFWDHEIYFYEAFILLLIYVLYVSFMTWNEHAKERAWETIGMPWKDLAVEMIRTEEKLNQQDVELVEVAGSPKVEEEEDDDDEDDDIWLPWGQAGMSVKGKFAFIFFYPLNFALWLTVPNCKLEAKKKYYPAAFFLSIVWIAVFAYFMVWWAEVSSKTLDIPSEVMGFTILAAGTSVPDLITSVIVAKKGFGDMAVSSSIGSNMFDITFGLPLPWVMQTIIDGLSKPIDVESKSLGSMVGMLFVMLFSTISCIACFGWRLNIMLGVTSFVLYAVFVTFSLLIEYEVIVI
ncbi:Sodium/potassium/calcium exchanger Nckx30C [Diplonema papillatum]|nr:Sodium/potassium/calcium exchanger Nckx30C [Diplonema papillatum]